MLVPVASLLQWSRGELLQDAHNRPVEVRTHSSAYDSAWSALFLPIQPVQVLQASKGRGLSHSTPPQPKTTHSRSLYPVSEEPQYPECAMSCAPVLQKPSPVHDMINSQPVKRRTESPHARTAPPLKRRKEGTPYPVRSYHSLCTVPDPVIMSHTPCTC